MRASAAIGNALANGVIRNYWEAPTVALLYQGGYLTIDRRIDFESVLLKIPNEEVRTSLYRGYISRLLGVNYDPKTRTFDDVRCEQA